MNAAVKDMRVEDFLARALLLEEESGERMEELADVMAVHHDSKSEALLRKLAHYSRKHADEVRGMTQGYQLPSLESWTIDWSDPESPETVPFDDLDYLMTETQILQLALESEVRGQRYYAAVADGAAEEEVKRLAAQFAEEEAEHVELIRRWIVSLSEQSPEAPDDLDPPNQPE
jgi:rubrerythrin